ncbi:hypothetical protein BGX21_004248, partial [Mortierella sp. AD011]
MANEIRLFCIVDKDSSPFSVKVFKDDTVDDLKKKIKKEKPETFSGVDADALVLWHVSIPSVQKRQIVRNNLTDDERAKKEPEELGSATAEISEIFGSRSMNGTIQVIVNNPQQ